MLALALKAERSITEEFVSDVPSSTLAAVTRLVDLPSGIFVDCLLDGLQVIAHDCQTVYFAWYSGIVAKLLMVCQPHP